MKARWLFYESQVAVLWEPDGCSMRARWLFYESQVAVLWEPGGCSMRDKDTCFMRATDDCFSRATDGSTMKVTDCPFGDKGGQGDSDNRWKGKLGAYAMKRVAADAHLPIPCLFDPAKCSDDRADYCLGWRIAVRDHVKSFENFLHGNLLCRGGWALNRIYSKQMWLNFRLARSKCSGNF